MPENLLVGIYLIETCFRPLYFRVIEYILVVLGGVLNITFGKPLKNYTIGKCQVGISSILQFYGKKTYRHVRYISRIDRKDLVNIIKAMKYKKNFEICAKSVNVLYLRSLYTANNHRSQIRHIGEDYNGRYYYGLLLEDIICLLDQSKNNHY